nr:hypothetical protein [Streptomyces sp. NRRL S-813]
MQRLRLQQRLWSVHWLWLWLWQWQWLSQRLRYGRGGRRSESGLRRHRRRAHQSQHPS